MPETPAGTLIQSGKSKEDQASLAPSGAPQSTRQTNQPPAPPIKSGETVDTTGGVADVGVPKEEFEKLRKLVADQQELASSLHRQNLELTRKLQQPVVAATPVLTEEQQNKEFFNAPATMIRQMISDEMKLRVDPLNARLEAVAGDRRFDKVKAEYADIWPYIESDLRNSVETARAQGNEITPQILEVLALATSGAYYRKQLAEGRSIAPAQVQNGNPPVPPVQQPINDPAFLRPSRPPTPQPSADAQVKREYTEVERRLMRERNMSEMQWEAYMNASPTDFLTMEKPKKEGAK